MEILDVENLSFRYAGSDRGALDSVGFSVSEGEFVLVCGATGSGKSTLFSLIKSSVAPSGEKSGSILFKNTPIEELDGKSAAFSIGYVMQYPEAQIVTDTVRHEISFALSNMGPDPARLEKTVAETAGCFGFSDIMGKRVCELSGGQKQLLCLASVMAGDPELLIVDEPTARLDPIAATAFIDTLVRLNRENGVTVILSEHRLDRLLPFADRIIILDGGRVVANGKPSEVCGRLSGMPEILSLMPAPVRMYNELKKGDGGRCPLTVRDGRSFLISEYHPSGSRVSEKSAKPVKSGEIALSLKNVCFRYRRELPDVLRDLLLEVYRGEIFCLFGGNGCGKSTLLSVAAGLLPCYAGSVRLFGKKHRDYKNGSLFASFVSLMPQDVRELFVFDSVREELAEVGFDEKSFPFDLSSFYDRHPYDLSGGEQQLVALAKVTAKKPSLLLLDEPTKGIDRASVLTLAKALKALRDGNDMTIVCVTHDAEFAACTADSCALFFDGRIISRSDRTDFLTDSRFYTTAAAAMSHGVLDGCTTVGEICARLREPEGGSAE